MARAKLRRGVELVKLANRIEALKAQEEDPDNTDFPEDATLAADQSRSSFWRDSLFSSGTPAKSEKRTLSKTIKGAIFKEVVMAKVREMRQQEETRKVTEQVEKESKDKGPMWM
jgi:calcium/calmodulin-dependent protein kinase I